MASFVDFPGLSNPAYPQDISQCKQNYKIETIISSNNHHSLSHVSGNIPSLPDLFKISNSRHIFDFKKEIRFVNQIKNTVLKLKEDTHQDLLKEFDPNLIDERVRDFYYDAKHKKMYVTLICGQIFIFNQKCQEGEKEDPGHTSQPQYKFMINKKVTLKQKILKSWKRP